LGFYGNTPDSAEPFKNKMISRWNENNGIRIKESEILVKKLSVLNYIFNSTNNSTSEESFQTEGYKPLLNQASLSKELNQFYATLFDSVERRSAEVEAKVDIGEKSTTDKNGNRVFSTDSVALMNFTLKSNKIYLDFDNLIKRNIRFIL
jgi:hypothetical protein